MTAKASDSKNAPVVQSDFEAQKRLVEELKVEWKQMWSERFNDKVVAEAVSVNDYAALTVERGDVLHASRDFKPLSFQDVLKAHEIQKPDRFVPNRAEGGWGKFIKTKVKTDREVKAKPKVENGKVIRQQQKRGWLHMV